MTLKFRADVLLGVLGGLWQFATSVAWFFLAVYFKEQLGFSGLQIGVLLAVHAVAGLFSALLAGLACDHFTSRSLAAWGLLVQGFGFWGLASFSGFYPVLAAYALWSLANWVIRLSMDVQLLKTDHGDATGQRIGLYQLLRMSGMTLGTVLTGTLLLVLDFRNTLAIAGCMNAVLFGVAWFLPPTPISPSVRFGEYLKDMAEPKVLWFVLFVFLFSTHWGAENTAYGLFLTEGLHLKMQGMGFYLATEYLSFALAAHWFGKRMQALSQIQTFALLGLLLSGIGHVGVVTPNVAISLGFRAMHGAGDGLLQVVLYFGLAKFFNVERMGGNTGLINTVSLLGFALGSLVYGKLGDVFGYAMPLWSSGLSILALSMPLIGLKLKAR